jgi:hypothetical protein
LLEGESEVKEEESVDGIIKSRREEGTKGSEAAKVPGRALTGIEAMHNAKVWRMAPRVGRLLVGEC